MRFITDFGDPGVLAPIAILIFVLLLIGGQRRTALAWLMLLGGGLGLIVVLKLSLADCHPPSLWAAIRTPSGHTASATLIYGGLFALLGAGVGLTVLAAAGVAMLIGLTRLILHAHLAGEAIVGGGIGVLGTGLLAVAVPYLGRRGIAANPFGLNLLVIALALALALHGVHWRLEPKIRYVSHHYWPFRVCRIAPHHYAHASSGRGAPTGNKRIGRGVDFLSL